MNCPHCQRQDVMPTASAFRVRAGLYAIAPACDCLGDGILQPGWVHMPDNDLPIAARPLPEIGPATCSRCGAPMFRLWVWIGHLGPDGPTGRGRWSWQRDLCKCLPLAVQMPYLLG
jgi:hypothetical protein